jgi:hypothetical protein
VVPAPEVEPLYLRGGDVHVSLALAVAVRPQETEPVWQHVEDATLALALLLTSVLASVLTLALVPAPVPALLRLSVGTPFATPAAADGAARPLPGPQ